MMKMYSDKEIDNMSKGQLNVFFKKLQKEYKDLESDLYEANNRINDLLDIVKQKDKIIDDMAEHLTTSVHSKEWVIKYFEERCK